MTANIRLDFGFQIGQFVYRKQLREVERKSAFSPVGIHFCGRTTGDRPTLNKKFEEKFTAPQRLCQIQNPTNCFDAKAQIIDQKYTGEKRPASVTTAAILKTTLNKITLDNYTKGLRSRIYFMQVKG